MDDRRKVITIAHPEHSSGELTSFTGQEMTKALFVAEEWIEKVFEVQRVSESF